MSLYHPIISTAMKSKKSHFKKFIFDLSLPKDSSTPLSLSSLRDVISDIDYTKKVAQTANILVDGQVNDRIF